MPNEAVFSRPTPPKAAQVSAFASSRLTCAIQGVARGLFIAAVLAGSPVVFGQTGKPATLPARSSEVDLGISSELKGRRVEAIFIRGNTQVSSNVIGNLIRTRVGDAFDPATVSEDYQRVFGLRKFANVEAKVEPTALGVNVVFVVTEQRQITAIRTRGNVRLEESKLIGTLDIKRGEAIDSFRISLARTSIESAYKDDNYPWPT